MLLRSGNPMAALLAENLGLLEVNDVIEEEQAERAGAAHDRRSRFTRWLRHINSSHTIEDKGDSDDFARDIVATPDVYHALTLDQKALLILEMLSGFTGGADERSIVQVLDDVQRHGQLRQLLLSVPVDSLKSKLDGESHRQLL